jgi:Phage capsid family
MADWPGGDPFADDAPDARPYGTRPDDPRPYGTRGYRIRPYGTRPYGTRPYGTRPYGTRPYGTRPYGTRPYGTRPEDDEPAATDPLDPATWSRDVLELFSYHSSVLRLGAQLVTSREYVSLPAVESPPAAAYLTRTRKPAAAGGVDVLHAPDKPAARITHRRLWPYEHELAWSVVVPDDIFAATLAHPEVVWRFKDDLARGLAAVADAQFLRGGVLPAPEVGPEGIAHREGVLGPVAGGSPADRLRAMLGALRDAGQWDFQRAGWILHPATLQAISAANAGGRRTWDSTRLIEPDGEGGGLLLGFPFALSAGVRLAGADPETLMFFSSDWGEAWIGAPPGVLRVDVSVDARFEQDETVVRAVLKHDFELRRTNVFVRAAG